MQEIQNLAEFMYLSYSQKLWEDGIRVPYFKQLSEQHKAAWVSSAQTAITFITNRKSPDTFLENPKNSVIIFS